MNSSERKKPFRLLKTLASIKVGVCVIVTLASLIAWGTLVEAHYNDSMAAQKIVYHSIWMYATMAALAVTLIAVMIDRWPWQQRHMGFVLAHIGILILMAGSLLTQYFGLDGSMSIGLGEKSRYVSVDNTVLSVYLMTPDGGSGYKKLSEQKVDFFSHRPTPEHPFELNVGTGKALITDYYPYAFRDEKVVDSNRETSGAAVRFQLQNARVSLTEWLVQSAPDQEAAKNLGPARVIFAPAVTSAVGPASTRAGQGCVGANCLILIPQKGSDALIYEIHTASEPKKVKKGTIKSGESIETGWMGLVLRILKVMPHAAEEILFQPAEQASPMSMPAFKLKFAGEEHWLGVNSMIKLFSSKGADTETYAVTFGNERRDVGFEVELKDFTIGRYPGTMRAASYSSVVGVPGLKNTTISMNEPLKHNGFTLYQASFQEDPETGRPIASIFSVNRDPGRWIKYLGSLFIVFGTIHLFYFKRKAARSAPTSTVKASSKG